MYRKRGREGEREKDSEINEHILMQEDMFRIASRWYTNIA